MSQTLLSTVGSTNTIPVLSSCSCDSVPFCSATKEIFQFSDQVSLCSFPWKLSLSVQAHLQVHVHVHVVCMYMYVHVILYMNVYSQYNAMFFKRFSRG